MIFIGLLEKHEGHAEKAKEWIDSITEAEHRFASTHGYLDATGFYELMSQATEEDTYVLLMQANSRVQESIGEDWITLMIEAMDSDESIWALAPRSTSGQVHQQPGPDFILEDKVELTFQLVFPVILIRGKAIQECGIFDERYVHYFADMDYSRELQAAGGTLAVYNGVVIEQDKELNAEIDKEMSLADEVSEDNEKYNEKWNLYPDSLDAVTNEYEELKPVMYSAATPAPGISTLTSETGIYIVFGEVIKAQGKIIKIV